MKLERIREFSNELDFNFEILLGVGNDWMVAMDSVKG